MMSSKEISELPIENMQRIYRKQSRDNIYDYHEHVAAAKVLDDQGRLPATFMVIGPGSWSDGVWDDINRMKTLNTNQSRRCQVMHICPLQIDIIERIVNRYSNRGEVVFDPFAGLFSVPYVAVKLGRKGRGIELNADYFIDAMAYMRAADSEVDAPTLFDAVNA
jgi:adenine-specific DNA methylase